MVEEWIDVKGLEGYYEVSNIGRVRSVPHPDRRLRRHNIIKPYKNNKGYWVVRYRRGKDRAVKAMIVHRQMAIAFIPNPTGLSDVNHKDGNKDNNTLGNLEWSTHLANVRHAFSNGLVASGEQRKLSKLTRKTVEEIKAKYIPFVYSQSKLAKEYGVSQTTIRFALIGKTWKETQ